MGMQFNVTLGVAGMVGTGAGMATSLATEPGPEPPVMGIKSDSVFEAMFLGTAASVAAGTIGFGLGLVASPALSDVGLPVSRMPLKTAAVLGVAAATFAAAQTFNYGRGA